jgi:hypothetical protein
MPDEALPIDATPDEEAQPTAAQPPARGKRGWLAAAIAVFVLLMAGKVFGHVEPVADVLNHWYVYPAVFAVVVAADAAIEYFAGRAYRDRA